ncbi:MAG TPA: hypothetical protein VJ772_01835 [Nitrososphaeraceae archaeon]|nr:hypothetical protein [Nitrososphaeraceae archaeon]
MFPKEEHTGQEQVTKQDIDFVIQTIIKEAEHDRISIRQLFYGMASAFTKIPIPHNVNSKNSGAGKSYLLNLVAEYYPSKNVMLLAGASSKALLHKEGIMVIKNEETGILEEVEPRIEKLEQELTVLQSVEKKTQDKHRIKDIEKEIRYLKKHQQKLIDLDNTIIIIQDTPEDSVLVNIMSLLSQDSQKDQEYIFADKSASGQIVQGSNIIRGMPVLFTTRVIDDTKHARFEETNRRSINVTPNVSKEKIESANNLIASKYGLLPKEYDLHVVSKEDKEKARQIISKLVDKLKYHTKYLGAKESGVKIPFAQSIANSIPSDDVWSMTVMDRIMRYLSIITKVNMDARPRFVNIETGAIYPISTFEDLKETLELMERGGSNIRPYIAEWYNKVFKPAYNELPEEPNTKVVDDKIRTEDRKGLTSNELAQKTKEVMKIPKPSADQILKKYIYPLLNQGIIDKVQSQISNRNNLYFPSDEDQNIFSLFSNNDFRLKVRNDAFYPSTTVLETLISENIEEKHHAEDPLEKIKFQNYRLLDHEGKEISSKELVERYLSNPQICFIVGDSNITSDINNQVED